MLCKAIQPSPGLRKVCARKDLRRARNLRARNLSYERMIFEFCFTNIPTF